MKKVQKIIREELLKEAEKSNFEIGILAMNSIIDDYDQNMEQYDDLGDDAEEEIGMDRDDYASEYWRSSGMDLTTEIENLNGNSRDFEDVLDDMDDIMEENAEDSRGREKAWKKLAKKHGMI